MRCVSIRQLLFACDSIHDDSERQHSRLNDCQRDAGDEGEKDEDRPSSGKSRNDYDASTESNASLITLVRRAV